MTLLLFVEMNSIRKRVYETLLPCSCYTLTLKGLSVCLIPSSIIPYPVIALPNPETCSPQASAIEKGSNAQSH